MLRFASDESSILEPYRFTGAALKFLFAFVDGMLGHLDLGQWLEQADPQMKAEADTAIAAGKRQNYPVFATPFPWIPVTSVI